MGQLGARRPLPRRHSLKLLQFTHQLCLLLGSHAGKDGALDQDLGAQGDRGGAEAAKRREQSMARCGATREARGQPYLGQQLGEVLHKDTKGGPAEGQVAGSGVWLHGVACGLVRILGAREAQLSSPCPP